MNTTNPSLGQRLVFVQEDVPGGQIPVDNLVLLQELHALANLNRAVSR